MKNVLYLICFCCLSQFSFADSPLTSTGFYKAYSELPIVEQVENNTMSDQTLKYLQGNNPIDIKLAVINAMSWGNKDLVGEYESSLFKIHKKLPKSYFDSLKVIHEMPDFLKKSATIETELSDDELICWAYLQAMGDYINPMKAFGAAAIGFSRKQENQSHAMVLGLIMAQAQMDRDWCQVYQVMDQLVFDPFYGEGIMRKEAKEIVFEYISLYKSSCEEESVEEEEVFEVGAEVTVDDRDLITIDGDEINVPDGLLAKQELVKKQKVDLAIKDIEYPEYISDIKGTRVSVTITNKGNTESLPCVGLLENNQNDSMESGEELIYKKEAVTLIPAVRPGESIDIQFEIPNYWVFDPNCEIRITIDALDHIPEKNKKNNVEEYNAYG